MTHGNIHFLFIFELILCHNWSFSNRRSPFAIRRRENMRPKRKAIYLEEEAPQRKLRINDQSVEIENQENR